jgi:hypothetical protein
MSSTTAAISQPMLSRALSSHASEFSAILQLRYQSKNDARRRRCYGYLSSVDTYAKFAKHAEQVARN